MSVLLRQPYGFEGLHVVREIFDSENLALADRIDLSPLQVSIRATAPAMPNETHRDPVASRSEVADRFYLVGVPGLAEMLELTHDRLPTYKRAWLGPPLRRPHDGVWVVQLTNGIHVPRVPCLEGRSHDLHVLLRHRPRSIPQLQESA